MTARKRSPEEDDNRKRLLDEAWEIIGQAKQEKQLSVASATLERAARIAGVWSEKPLAVDSDAPPATQVFTSEPLSPEQWSEKFAPKED